MHELLKGFDFNKLHIRLVGVKMYNLKKHRELIDFDNKLKGQKSITD